MRIKTMNCISWEPKLLKALDSPGDKYRITKLENHCFAIPNVIVDLSNNHQWFWLGERLMKNSARYVWGWQYKYHWSNWVAEKWNDYTLCDLWCDTTGKYTLKNSCVKP